ncbi:hypothetical protein NLI96_g3997 [Meripilus lineatus]|uniref:Uncharacterized protein n=1 Tax=Meripilus lineatus TaxID=2056292 RepID=A0AAD5YIF3_9APHY|nr:hypothetical protein NLI96_g3997 [Physisporinus lineatus]
MVRSQGKASSKGKVGVRAFHITLVTHTPAPIPPQRQRAARPPKQPSAPTERAYCSFVDPVTGIKCPKSVSRGGDLRRHYYTHLEAEDRPIQYKCTELLDGGKPCTYWGTQSSNLKTHIRTPKSQFHVATSLSTSSATLKFASVGSAARAHSRDIAKTTTESTKKALGSGVAEER